MDSENQKLGELDRDEAYSFSLAYIEVAIAAGRIEEASTYTTERADHESDDYRLAVWEGILEGLEEDDPQPRLVSQAVMLAKS